MGRPVIRAILALFVTLAWSNISNGGANSAKQIELTGRSDEIQVSSMKNSLFRATRDAKRKSHRRGKGKNQNKRNPDKGRKKSRNAKKNTRKNNKKMERNRKNRMKQKRKEKLRKTKKKNTKKEKKSRTKKNRSKKDKKKSRKNKKKPGQRKKSKQNKKELRKNRRKLGKEKIKNAISKWKPKATCDEEALCQKIKDYIKISNQLRKVRRIVKSCDTMDKKAKKSAAEFEATVEALETAIGSTSGRRMYRSRWRRASQSSDDVTNIKDKLKNCSLTAKAKCQKSSVAPCQEEANLTKCETELQGWLTKFGPAKGSCLQASSDCCACITALEDVSKDCLAFDKKSTLAVASKKKCTSGDEQGSFGFCRKLQIEAAEKGPKHAKNNCKHPEDVTTAGIPHKAGIPCKNYKNSDHRPCILTNGRPYPGYCCPLGSKRAKTCQRIEFWCYLGDEVLESTASPSDNKCYTIPCTSSLECFSKSCPGCNIREGRCEDWKICHMFSCSATHPHCPRFCHGCNFVSGRCEGYSELELSVSNSTDTSSNFTGVCIDNNKRFGSILQGSSRSDNGNSVTSCRNTCTAPTKYKYFGVENGTTCLCGDKLHQKSHHPGVPQSNCNITCPGQTGQLCGGSPDYLNLYSTTP